MSQPTQQSAIVTAGNDAKASDHNAAVTDLTNSFSGWFPIFGVAAATTPPGSPAMFLMQIGTITVALAADLANVTFNKAFPTTSFMVMPLNINAAVGSKSPAIASHDQNGFVIDIPGGGNAIVTLAWLAIGY